MLIYKTCTECFKNFEDIPKNFYRRATTKDGYSSQCRKCYNRESYRKRKARKNGVNENVAGTSLFRKNLETLFLLFPQNEENRKIPMYIAGRKLGSPTVNLKAFRVTDSDRGLFMATEVLRNLSGIHLWQVSHHRLSELISRDGIEIVYPLSHQQTDESILPKS